MSSTTITAPSGARRIGRVAAVLTATGVLVLAAPIAAQAHVHVDPSDVSAGGYSTFTFTVPNESATAATSSVAVELPTDTPFTFAAVEPVAGWTAEVVTETLPAPVEVGGSTVTAAPVRIVWTAADADSAIGDGEFQRFAVRMGPVPDVTEVLLPVSQTYTDGDVVRWDEPTPVSGEEPEYPAPVLVVGEAAGDGHSHGTEEHQDEATEEMTSTGGTALTVGFIGLGLGAAALVVAVLALVRRRA